MKSYKSSLCAVAATIAAFSNTAIAAQFAIEGRSMGMGNVSVATADIATAAFGNPSMLANQRADDDFSLLIGLGGMINDDGKMLDDIDDFQAADANNDLAGMATAINNMNGKVIAPELTTAFAFGFAGETYSFAVSARGDLISAGTLTNVDITNPGLVDPTKNILSFEGVLATEIGVSIARKFDVMGSELSIGIKPKVVQYEAKFFDESVLTIGDSLSDLTDDGSTVELDDVVTVDLGVAYDLTDSVRLGFVAKNLITDDFQVGAFTFEVNTEYRAGIAYHSDFLTVGFDLDLKENDPLLSNPVFSGLKTQYASVGAEFNVFDYVQLRVGASENIAGGIPDGAKETSYYAGIGFWLGFNLDVAVASRDESLGAYLQIGFKF